MKATNSLRKDFCEAGFPMPDNIRVSCGLPGSGAFKNGMRTIGEC